MTVQKQCEGFLWWWKHSLSQLDHRQYADWDIVPEFHKMLASGESGERVHMTFSISSYNCMSIYNDLTMFNLKKVCVCVCITVRAHHPLLKTLCWLFISPKGKPDSYKAWEGPGHLASWLHLPLSSGQPQWPQAHSHSQPWPLLSQWEALFSKIPTRFILSLPQIFAQKSFPWAPQPPPYLKLFSLASPILPYFIFLHSTYYHQRNYILYTFPY